MKGMLTIVCALAAAAIQAADVPRVKLGDEVRDGRPSVRWRGFNLLDMFIMGRNPEPGEFKEWDFRKISEWGFNFVRLPMDYRFWVKDGKFENWDVFDEEHLKHVDRAVELGRKYGVHVMINLHRAPGYTVCTSPKEPADLFSDPEAQRVCAKHWAMFARRYRGIPNEALSFNLFNEPPPFERVGTNYVAVIRLLERAIHAEDPGRFIVADAYGWGQHPIDGIADLPRVGQSMHNYAPKRVTHFASKYDGMLSRKPPRWPVSPDAPLCLFGGPSKRNLNVPWRYCDMPPGTMEIQLDRVSGDFEIEVKADGRLIGTRTFAPRTNATDWVGVRYYPQWKLHNGVWEGTWTIDLPDGAKELSLFARKGDWIVFDSVLYRTKAGAEHRLVYSDAARFELTSGTTQLLTEKGFVSSEPQLRRYADDGCEFLDRARFAQWDETIRRGGFLFMGEFGVTGAVPNREALGLVKANLILCRDRNMGWAMWRLHGGMGIVDNKRADADQIEMDGHTVDRGLLKLLQSY